MGAKTQPVLDPGDLNDTDEEILDLLHEGRATPPFIAEELGKSREYASERLIRLKEHGNAKRIAPGLYELVEDPRDDTTTEDVDSEALKADIDKAHDELEELQMENQRLQRDLNDARDRLDTDAPSVDVDVIRDDLQRALSQLPSDVRGRTKVEDALAQLEEDNDGH